MDARCNPYERDTLEDDDLAERLNAAYADEGPNIDTILKQLAEWEAWEAERVAGR